MSGLAMSGPDFTGKYESVVPREASSILLMQDGPNGAEVFMVKRHHKIDFASGAVVFPGGKVEDGDRIAASSPLITGAQGLSDKRIGMRVAAIRETFEEIGVLIARDENGAELSAERVAQLTEKYQKAIDKGETTIADMLTAEKLTLPLDELTLFAHWVTPPTLAKRFDTAFYIIKMPAAQADLARHDGREAVESSWQTAQGFLDKAKSGEITMVFATQRNLEKLARSNSTADAVAAAEADTIVRVCPDVRKEGDKIILRIPAEAGFGGPEFIRDAG